MSSTRRPWARLLPAVLGFSAGIIVGFAGWGLFRGWRFSELLGGAFTATGALTQQWSAWTKLLGTSAAVLTTLATAMYLFATWALLLQTSRAHKENLSLTRRLHADTLTPVLFLKAVRQDLRVSSRTNPDLRVATLAPNPDGTLRANDLTDLPESNLVLMGEIAVEIGNASANIADTLVATSGAAGDLQRRTIVAPNQAVTMVFDVDRPFVDLSEIRATLEGCASVQVSAVCNGPGTSAQDGFDATIAVALEPQQRDIGDSDSWLNLRRYREYDPGAWKHA